MLSDVLRGKTVVEIGSMLAAPFAAHILAQMGADVVKVEPPRGDATRHLVRGGPSGTFIAYNRGKRSLCLDLAMPQGRAALDRLLSTADVLVHNLAPAATRKLLLTRESCRSVNPRLVYCHIRGYGAGPQEELLASNPAIEAATGVMHGHRINARPARLGPSYHDQFAGTYAVIGVLGELLARDRRAGSGVEFGLFETGLHLAARDLVAVQLKLQLGVKVEGESGGEFNMPGYGAYETRDGRWIYLVMLSDEHWRKFCRALEPAAGTEDGLATLKGRKQAREHVEGIVRGAVRRYDYPALAQRLEQVQLGFSEVVAPQDVLQSAQTRVPGKTAHLAFQSMQFEAPNFPLNDAAHDRAPPLLGEHTREILHGLGYCADEVQSFVDAGAAGVADSSGPLWRPARPAAA